MVIEDDPTDVFLVRETLRVHGLEVEDGEAAITLCAATLCQRFPRSSVVGVSGYEPAAGRRL